MKIPQKQVNLTVLYYFTNVMDYETFLTARRAIKNNIILWFINR